MSQLPPDEASPASKADPASSALAAKSTATSGVPLWATLVISLVCLGIGLAMTLLISSRKKVAVANYVPASSCAELPKKPQPSELELAAQGDPRAVDSLEKLDPSTLSIEQALALSQGRAAVKRLALNHLRNTIQKENGTPDTEVTKRLVQFARDVDTARDVIGLFATLPGPIGPDLLYEFANDKKAPPELSRLAEQLLMNKQVRHKASPALALALDLREATTCEQRQSLLEKAPEMGDRRMLGTTVGLINKQGCGPKKHDDCNPCLHEDNSKLIRSALAKIQARKAPSY